MCGILVTNKDIGGLDSNYLEKDILRTLVNRGPDYTSHKIINQKYHFIHTLLSMTGPATPQPFQDIQNEIYCTFNGEIYNFKQFGEDFVTDGECLIPLYKKYGLDFIKYLDGEFAIVLIDIRNNLLIVSTDTFGTRPLRMTINNKDFGISTYQSCLDKISLNNSFHVPANTTYILDLTQLKLIEQKPVHVFDLNQFKYTFDDWETAFKKSITKRTQYAKCGIYIGMSGGYDSGAIACELTRQNIDFTAYSIANAEDPETLNNRAKLINDPQLVNVTRKQFLQARDFLKDHAEEYYLNIDNGEKELYLKYIKDGMSHDHPTIKQLLKVIKFREQGQVLTGDNGAIGCSYITSLAKNAGQKIYLSGSGADEIFSDYGYNKAKFFNHSTIGGYFPEDLSKVFPWKNFYGNTQRAYLMKEEHVAGAYGVEGRYPFLDIDVVQEFLWLSPSLKNSAYKSPLHYYLNKYKFPYEDNNKTGFGCGFNGPTSGNQEYQQLTKDQIESNRSRADVTSISGRVKVDIDEVANRKFSTLEDFRIIDPSEIIHTTGNMYQYNGNINFLGEKYTLDKSTYTVLENGIELKQSCIHSDIIDKHGYFSIWTNSTIFFSTSDGTDPRTNNKRYTIINNNKQNNTYENSVTLIYNISNEVEQYYKETLYKNFNLEFDRNENRFKNTTGNFIGQKVIDNIRETLYYNKSFASDKLIFDNKTTEILLDNNLDVNIDNIYYELALKIAKEKKYHTVNYIVCDGAAGSLETLTNSKYKTYTSEGITINIYKIHQPEHILQFVDSKQIICRGYYQYTQAVFKNITFLPAQSLELLENPGDGGTIEKQNTFTLPLYSNILCTTTQEEKYYKDKFTRQLENYYNQDINQLPVKIPNIIRYNKFPTSGVSNIKITNDRIYDLCFIANGTGVVKNIPLMVKFLEYINNNKIDLKILIICENSIFDRYRSQHNITIIDSSEVHNRLDTQRIYKLFSECRSLMTLSIWDNDPRTIIESLSVGCYNICFKQLYGGSQNITPTSGLVIDLKPELQKIVNIEIDITANFDHVWSEIVNKLLPRNIDNVKISQYYQTTYSLEIESTNIINNLK